MSEESELIYRIYAGSSNQLVAQTKSMRSLKHHKKDVASISKGMECGVIFHSDVRVDLQDEAQEKKRLKKVVAVVANSNAVSGDDEVGDGEEMGGAVGRGVAPGDRIVCLKRVAVPPQLESS